MPYLVCRGVGLIGNMKHQSKNVYFLLMFEGIAALKNSCFCDGQLLQHGGGNG